MVDDDLQRSADELRDTAAKLKVLANQTRSTVARQELLDLAERFEAMARQIDGRPPQDQSS